MKSKERKCQRKCIYLRTAGVGELLPKQFICLSVSSQRSNKGNDSGPQSFRSQTYLGLCEAKVIMSCDAACLTNMPS